MTGLVAKEYSGTQLAFWNESRKLSNPYRGQFIGPARIIPESIKQFGPGVIRSLEAERTKLCSVPELPYAWAHNLSKSGIRLIY